MSMNGKTKFFGLLLVGIGSIAHADNLFPPLTKIERALNSCQVIEKALADSEENKNLREITRCLAILELNKGENLMSVCGTSVQDAMSELKISRVGPAEFRLQEARPIVKQGIEGGWDVPTPEQVRTVQMQLNEAFDFSQDCRRKAQALGVLLKNIDNQSRKCVTLLAADPMKKHFDVSYDFFKTVNGGVDKLETKCDELEITAADVRASVRNSLPDNLIVDGPKKVAEPGKAASPAGFPEYGDEATQKLMEGHGNNSAPQVAKPADVRSQNLQPQGDPSLLPNAHDKPAKKKFLTKDGAMTGAALTTGFIAGIGGVVAALPGGGSKKPAIGAAGAPVGAGGVAPGGVPSVGAAGASSGVGGTASSGSSDAPKGEVPVTLTALANANKSATAAAVGAVVDTTKSASTPGSSKLQSAQKAAGSNSAPLIATTTSNGKRALTSAPQKCDARGCRSFAQGVDCNRLPPGACNQPQGAGNRR